MTYGWSSKDLAILPVVFDHNCTSLSVKSKKPASWQIITVTLTFLNTVVDVGARCYIIRRNKTFSYGYALTIAII